MTGQPVADVGLDLASIATMAAAGSTALVTYLLGKRSEQQKERDGALEGWRELTVGLRSELTQVRKECREQRDELEAEIIELREHMAEQDRRHANDRAQWQQDKRVLVEALRRGDNTPPPTLR
jgi:hypothetical protein